MSRVTFLRALPLLLLMGLVFAVYAPGLRSAFLLDDYQNLKGLSALTVHSDWGAWLAYLFSDVSGPVGRPIAMFSFLLQQKSWPGDPGAFKAANLVLHLLTGGVLYLFFERLIRVAMPRQEGRAWLALFAAGMWWLAPLQVSTVLYAVQRMTQLSALFLVLGLWAWLHGRVMLADGRREGWLWVSLGLLGGGGLAVLSKETGALMPLFVLVLEGTLLASLSAPKGWGRWKALFLWLPLSGLAVFLVLRFGTWVMPGYSLRDFSLGERLLTEPRVLLDYLRMGGLPRGADLGLFHDDYVISRGWMDPPSTLGAAALLAMAGVGALVFRRRYPIPAFGILWFLGGHLLEGSVLPLELYFEHRNYLPLAGVYLALAMSVGQIGGRIGTSGRRMVLAGLCGVWLAFMGWLTWNESRLWGQPVLQASVWAERHPHSLRAQERLGAVWAMRGDYPKAAGVFASIARSGHVGGYLLWWQAGCYDESIPLPAGRDVVQGLHDAPFANMPVAVLEQIVHLREGGGCSRLDGPVVKEAFQALLENPAFASRREPLLGLLGRWEWAEGHPGAALDALEKAFALRPAPETALFMAHVALTQGWREPAAGYLRKGREALAQRRVQGDLGKEFEAMEHRLRTRSSDEQHHAEHQPDPSRP